MDGILDQVSLKVAYKTTFILYLLCCVATGYALFSASWLRSRVVVGKLDVRSSYGLAVYCTNQGRDETECRFFPQDADCGGDGELFCAAWHTAAFAMTAASVLKTGCIIAYLTILFGSCYVRESGWKVLVYMIGADSGLQIISTVIMALLLEFAPRFDVGQWQLGSGWAAACTSWTLGLFLVVALAIVGVMSPRIGYDPLYDPADLESIATESDAEHDDFYYFNRHATRSYLATAQRS